MISLNLKWFVGLSAAAHVAALATWHAPVPAPGHSGHALRVSIVQQTGTSPAQAVDRQTAKPAQQTGNTAPRANPDSPVSNPRKAARAQPVTPTDTTPSHDTVKQVASTPSSISSSPVNQQQAIDQHLRNSVLDLISQELTYPAIARRKGWQGVVTLALHIEADGSISSLQLNETSGYAVLDTAAIQCLRTASVPNATHWLQGKAIDLIVPVEYRLTGG